MSEPLTELIRPGRELTAEKLREAIVDTMMQSIVAGPGILILRTGTQLVIEVAIDRVFPLLSTQPYFARPRGMCFDSNFVLYVADSIRDNILVFSSQFVSPEYWGSTGIDEGFLSGVLDVAFDGTHIYTADGTTRLQKWTKTGTWVASSGSTPAINSSVAALPGGPIYLARSSGTDSLVVKYNTSLDVIGSVGLYGSGTGQYSAPAAVGVDPSGAVYVADSGRKKIIKYNSAGTYQVEWSNSGSSNGEIVFPTGIAFDSLGDVFVIDGQNARVTVWSNTGVYKRQWGSSGFGNAEFIGPSGISIDVNNKVYVSDLSIGRITVFDTDGNFLSMFGAKGAFL